MTISRAELYRRWLAGRSIRGLARRHGLTVATVEGIIRRPFQRAATRGGA